MSNIEVQNHSLLEESQNSPLPCQPESERRQNDFSSSRFPCNFLYACEICDGPLVPTALCIVCKRTSIRKCLHCQRDIITDTHPSCSTLILFARSILHARQNNKGVNL